MSSNLEIGIGFGLMSVLLTINFKDIRMLAFLGGNPGQCANLRL